MPAKGFLEKGYNVVSYLFTNPVHAVNDACADAKQSWHKRKHEKTKAKIEKIRKEAAEEKAQQAIRDQLPINRLIAVLRTHKTHLDEQVRRSNQSYAFFVKLFEQYSTKPSPQAQMKIVVSLLEYAGNLRALLVDEDGDPKRSLSRDDKRDIHTQIDDLRDFVRANRQGLGYAGDYTWPWDEIGQNLVLDVEALLDELAPAKKASRKTKHRQAI
jgi:hypothetical protein